MTLETTQPDDDEFRARLERAGEQQAPDEGEQNPVAGTAYDSDAA